MSSAIEIFNRALVGIALINKRFFLFLFESRRIFTNVSASVNLASEYFDENASTKQPEVRIEKAGRK